MSKTLLILFMTLATACAASAAVPSSIPASTSQESTNKAVAGRVFEEIFNQGKFQVADEIYAPDFANHGEHRDAFLAEDQAAVHAEKAACPDLRMTVNMMVAEGDLVTVVWTFKGTHTGARYYGLPATGTRIQLRGITVWRIVDGKIRDEWTSFDRLGMFIQFAAQLKWWLMSLLLAVVLLSWAVCRGIVRAAQIRSRP
jgi:steroid delta-isomerase-like uncharacterized protein